MLKKLIALSLCAIMATGMAASVSAATERHSLTVTASRATSEFTYGSGGTLLEVKITTVECHTQTGDHEEGYAYGYAHGSQTTARATRYPYDSYEITNADSIAYVGGVEHDTIADVTP